MGGCAPWLPSHCLRLGPASVTLAGSLSPHHLLLLTLFFLPGFFRSSGFAWDVPHGPGQGGSPTGLLSTVAERGCPGGERGIVVGAAILHPEISTSPSQRRDLEGCSRAGWGTGESLGRATWHPSWSVLLRPLPLVPPVADAGIVHVWLNVLFFCCSSCLATRWWSGVGRKTSSGQKS